MFRIMMRLSRLLGDLTPILFATVILGAMGYLSAIAILSLGAAAMLRQEISLKILLAMLFFALLRGVLHYAEQLSGHYMAFKVLATLRDKVFTAMRKLAPAKLAKQKQGEWIAVLTGDIELLEVFYAHTLPPIWIAVVVCLFMIGYLGSFHPALGLVAALAYGCIGFFLPWRNTKRTQKNAKTYRQLFRQANDFMLENIYGMEEILRFHQGKKRKETLERVSRRMTEAQNQLKRAESFGVGVTEACLLLFSFGMLFLVIYLVQNQTISYQAGVMALVGMFSSFGSVVALSNLSISLANTLSAGERVLDLLEEEPETKEILTGLAPIFAGGECKEVTFSYEETPVLSQVSLAIPQRGIVGIKGKSGSGKSTLLRLLMRYWDPQKGQVFMADTDVRRINSQHLRHMQACVMQETFLFEGSLLDNIRLSKPNATMDEVHHAAQMAGIHGFITTLTKGYNTPLGELGQGLSAGERQRIGLARAFLHNADFLLLDEPTSNLDALNEAMLLHSLREVSCEKSVLLVSHRLAALRVADCIMEIEPIGGNS